MEDDQRDFHEPSADHDDALEETLEQLLPVPDEAPTEPGQIDSPIDNLLPLPGESYTAPDDASTSEELEVDTTADGVDDIIVLAESVPRGDDDATTSWLDDNEPLSDESDFIAAMTADESETESTDTGEGLHDVSEDATTTEPVAGICPGCGDEVGAVAYCPRCGTEQVPTTRTAAILLPLIAWTKPLSARITLLGGAALVLLALLADSGAAALIIGSAILPVIMVSRIAMEVRQQKREHQVQVLLMAFGGLVLGLIIAWLGSRTVNNSWFDSGVLNYGAAGFGGMYAHTAGSAPFLVWLMNGLILPILTIAAIGALPYGLRLSTNMPSRESSGVLLSAAVAAGYVIASAIAFFRPLFSESAPSLGTSEWTLTIIGLAVVRPLVWIFAGAIIGAVVWRYMRTADLGTVMVPGVIAIALPLLFSLVTLGMESVSLWLEVLLGLVFAAAGWYLYRRYLLAAMKQG
ncbi:MAG: hypothetical protein M9909_13770 [Thermomicrobiales bacterium]|nr:hypothetical protein [Thermomicrobiales bacterium]